jgi:hypothetical protein
MDINDVSSPLYSITVFWLAGIFTILLFLYNLPNRIFVNIIFRNIMSKTKKSAARRTGECLRPEKMTSCA